MPVLVQVGEDELGVVLETVEHPIAVVRVDVDIGHAPDAVSPAQRLDRHAGVIEDAETGGRIAACVVQPRDGYEGAPAVAAQDRVHRIQHRAHDIGAGLVHAAKRRRVAVVEIALPGLRLARHARDVLGRVEQQQVFARARNRRGQLDLSVKSAAHELAPERLQAIRTERMTLTEAVGSERLAIINPHVAHRRIITTASWTGLTGFTGLNQRHLEMLWFCFNNPVNPYFASLCVLCALCGEKILFRIPNSAFGCVS